MGNSIRIEQLEKLYTEIPKFRKLLNYDKLIAKLQTQENGIISLVNDLDWNLPEEQRKKAAQAIINSVDMDDYDLLIIAGNKCTWSNSVLLLKEIGYPKNKKALPSLILLLQDLNWPGAVEGIEVLRQADKRAVIPLLEVAIEEGYSSCDYIWLAGIKTFLEFTLISKDDFSRKETYDLLEYAEW